MFDLVSDDVMAERFSQKVPQLLYYDESLVKA